MKTQDILILFQHNVWANQRILAAAANLTTEQFVTPTAHNLGSLRAILTHILDAEITWRMFCQRNPLARFDVLTEQDFPTFDHLQRRWLREEQALRDYIATLTDADLLDSVRYPIDDNLTRESRVWHSLYHLVNHGSQHRSQAAAILTAYGHSENGLDFLQFLNTQII